MTRDRDVRNAIHDALIATNAFDGVWIWGLPENYGTNSGIKAAAAIEPFAGSTQDVWDGGSGMGLVETATVAITFLYRDEDPQIRDEGAEMLRNVAMDALNGQGLGGLTMPDKTRFTSYQWRKPVVPERRIATTFTYQYIVDGWNSFGIDP